MIEKIKDKKIRQVYAENTIKNSWSRNVLCIQIERKFHERIGNSDNNFNVILPPKNSDLLNNTIKDPYIFDFIALKDKYRETELENELVIRIKNVLLELGKGFSWYLKSSSVPIGVSMYEIKEKLPKDLLDKLPTEEDINLHIDI